ncbi:MAG: cell division inhibitor [Bacteroidetes bacterium]|nr:cell division inhibitor [Bacteroidota bacterium]
MAIHHLNTSQFLAISLDEAWEFFSSPDNLAEITPQYLDFQIEFKTGDTAYPGQMIRYKIKPVWGISLQWLTEITVVKDKEFFIDEQRQGPYRLWHHEHRFREVEGGIRMEDILTYSLPFGIIGELMHRLWIKRQIEGIFQYRKECLESLFDRPRASLAAI